jgi:hypothetical protein
VGILILSSLQIPLLVSVPHAKLKVALTITMNRMGVLGKQKNNKGE